MIICITARGEELNSEVDPAFGRAAYFLFIDPEAFTPGAPTPEALIMETVENVPGAHGAGVQAAQTVAAKKASAVITGSVGPNAYQGLSAAGIKIYTGAKGTIKEALEDYRAGRLTDATGATGARHGGGMR
jgi:predicted Fe-Mo cluster-binding NifX family protein